MEELPAAPSLEGGAETDHTAEAPEHLCSTVFELNSGQDSNISQNLF